MKSPVTQLVLSLILLTAVVAAYGVWYSIIQSKSSEVATLEQQIETNADTQTRVAAARASLAEIAQDEASIKSYFISEDDIASFNDQLESQRHAPGATVKVLSESKTGTGAQSALTFIVSVDGSFDAVMRTIGMIEFAPYAINVLGVTLSEGDKTKGGWHADLTLLVSSIPTSTASTSPMVGTTTPTTP